MPVDVACMLNAVLQRSESINDQTAYGSAAVTDENNLEQERRRESSVVGNANLRATRTTQLQAHLVPGPVVVLLRAPDLHPLLAHIEGEDQLSMGQEERHEVILPGIRHVEDEAGDCVRPQGQGEVGPGKTRSIQ